MGEGRRRSLQSTCNVPSINSLWYACSFIPDHVFSELRNLTSLDLSSNHLDHVWPRTFTGLRGLVRLRLADNRLTELPEGVLRHSARCCPW